MIFSRNIKFKKVVKMWLLFKKVSIKKSTFYRYQYIVNKYLLSYFKDKRLRYFINYDFNIFIDYLSKNLSEKTVSDILIVLKGILKYIEKRYNYNYKIDLISIPKHKYNKIKTLESDEMFRLQKNWHSNMFTHRYENWKDMCFKNVLQQIYENNFSEDAFFLTGNKKYIEPRYYQKFFKEYLKECKIKNYNFHVLRHSFATNCVKIGMDVKSISEILGHSDVKVTLNRYIHSSIDTKKEYLNKL